VRNRVGILSQFISITLSQPSSESCGPHRLKECWPLIRNNRNNGDNLYQYLAMGGFLCASKLVKPTCQSVTLDESFCFPSFVRPSELLWRQNKTLGYFGPSLSSRADL